MSGLRTYKLLCRCWSKTDQGPTARTTLPGYSVPACEKNQPNTHTHHQQACIYPEFHQTRGASVAPSLSVYSETRYTLNKFWARPTNAAESCLQKRRRRRYAAPNFTSSVWCLSVREGIRQGNVCTLKCTSINVQCMHTSGIRRVVR